MPHQRALGPIPIWPNCYAWPSMAASWQQTNLDRLRPGAQIDFTSLGRYDELLEHISAHRWYMGIERPAADRLG